MIFKDSNGLVNYNFTEINSRLAHIVHKYLLCLIIALKILCVKGVLGLLCYSSQINIEIVSSIYYVELNGKSRLVLQKNTRSFLSSYV